jgi:chromosome segregation ATPase
MELELQGWKVKLAIAALVVVVIAAPFARASKSNKDRAEDWHKRAVVAEESVAGLRAVIVERSRELNRRTTQANQLASKVESNGTALRRSKVSASTLARRQRQLASEKARLEAERRRLSSRLSSLERISSQLGACANAGEAILGSGEGPRAVSAAERARLASCRRAAASLDAYRKQAR